MSSYNSHMDKLFKLLNNLEEQRQIPQFLFADIVHGNSMLKVRIEIDSYLKNGGDSDKIDFVINSPGGLADEAYRIIRTLRDNFEEVNIIVPFWAKSAATLLSLGGNNIIMDKFGEFGPLDAQIGKEREDNPEFEHVSALNDEFSLSQLEYRFKGLYESMFIQLYENSQIRINKKDLSEQVLQATSKFYEPLIRQMDPYKIGHKRRTLEIGEQYATRILGQFNNVDIVKARKLVNYLVNGCPHHGYIIDYHLISKFLDNVKLSVDISPEYEDVLKKVSTIMIENSNGINFVGFVPKINEQNNKKPKPKPKVRRGRKLSPTSKSVSNKEKVVKTSVKKIDIELTKNGKN